MLPPLEVFPALSNAFRYSSATDLRCSSVIVPRVIAMSTNLATTREIISCVDLDTAARRAATLDFRRHPPSSEFSPKPCP